MSFKIRVRFDFEDILIWNKSQCDKDLSMHMSIVLKKYEVKRNKSPLVHLLHTMGTNHTNDTYMIVVYIPMVIIGILFVCWCCLMMEPIFSRIRVKMTNCVESKNEENIEMGNVNSEIKLC